MAAPPAKPQPDHSRAKNAKHSREKAQGFVYFIQSIHGGPVKIGWAKNPKARLPELQCGSPVKLIIAGTAQLKRETGLVANGGLLQGLRNRGLVRSRVEEVWQDFNQHSTTYWATWLVAAREPKAAIA